jgi:hypothetical protein
MRKMVVFVEYAKQKAAEKNGGVNKLPTKYVLGGGNLTLFDATEETVGINKILGLDIAQMPDSYDVQYVKIVQARKHKEKRINKKWLKRYGYKTVIVNSKGWNVKTHTDGTVEFVK